VAEPSGHDTRKARCVETRTPGLAGGQGKPTGSNPGTASLPDPTLITIHRDGWQVTLLPDGTCEARSPDGKQILRTNAPP
jgi:hypothetical protein